MHPSGCLRLEVSQKLSHPLMHIELFLVACAIKKWALNIIYTLVVKLRRHLFVVSKFLHHYHHCCVIFLFVCFFVLKVPAGLIIDASSISTHRQWYEIGSTNGATSD